MEEGLKDPNDGTTLDAVPETDQARMRLLVLVALGGVAAYLLARLLAPFTLAIVTSAVLAVLAYPVYAKLAGRLRNESVAALVTTTAVLVLVLIPLAVLTMLLVNGIESGWSVVSGRAEAFLSREGPAWRWLVSAAGLMGLEGAQLSTALQDQLTRLGSAIAGGTLGLLSGLGGWAVQGAISLFALFYLLRDGRDLLETVRWFVPLDEGLTSALIGKTHEVAVATVLGTLLVAVIQGTLGGLLFWALGLPGPALWGVVMAFFALLPALGPPVVWVPAAVLTAAAGAYGKAAVLVAAGALVVGTVDNVLRSIFVSGRAQLHSLAVFFSVLGGLIVFGLAGFLLGPVVFVVALSVMEIARVALGDGQPGSRLARQNGVLSSITS